jgi:hypothetical protein
MSVLHLFSSDYGPKNCSCEVDNGPPMSVFRTWGFLDQVAVSSSKIIVRLVRQCI